MEYNLKKFINVGSRLGDYFISFSKSGFTISSGFYVKEGIKDFSKAVFYFDAEKSAVGIQFVKDDTEEGAYKIVHNDKDTGGTISSRSFVTANDLDKEKYFGRKTPKKIIYQGAEIFVIDLLRNEKNELRSEITEPEVGSPST